MEIAIPDRLEDILLIRSPRFRRLLLLRIMLISWGSIVPHLLLPLHSISLTIRTASLLQLLTVKPLPHRWVLWFLMASQRGMVLRLLHHTHSPLLHMHNPLLHTLSLLRSGRLRAMGMVTRVHSRRMPNHLRRPQTPCLPRSNTRMMILSRQRLLHRRLNTIFTMQ